MEKSSLDGRGEIDSKLKAIEDARALGISVLFLGKMGFRDSQNGRERDKGWKNYCLVTGESC